MGLRGSCPVIENALSFPVGGPRSGLHPSTLEITSMTRTLLSLAVLLGASLAHAAPLPVTATTSILADFAKNVGGLRVTVTTIVPAGTDAHTFQPTTTVIRQLAGSRLLFLNGANLEPWLPQVQAANPGAKAVILTTG